MDIEFCPNMTKCKTQWRNSNYAQWSIQTWSYCLRFQQYRWRMVSMRIDFFRWKNIFTNKIVFQIRWLLYHTQNTMTIRLYFHHDALSFYNTYERHARWYFCQSIIFIRDAILNVKIWFDDKVLSFLILLSKWSIFFPEQYLFVLYDFRYCRNV